ncbi:MAG: hypothetical protein ACKVZH_19345, partial [Blastocatellia bacterium]
MKTTRTLILYIQSIWQTINRLAATAIAPRKLALILIVVFAVGGVAVKSKSFLINRLASKSAVALPAACSNQVTNGDFSSSLSGWTSSGAWGEHPGGGSAFTLLDGASNESLSQTINNLNSGPVLGQVTINFSIGSDDGGGVQTNTATLNISLNGTVYASFSNPNNSNTVTGTGQNGGSLNITSFTDNGVFNHGFQLTIPWVAQPNSAPLAFSFSSSSPIGDDFFVDNVVIDGGCPPPSPTLTKAFSPTSINAGSNSTLTFTIANSAGNPAQSGINFTDTFPANLKVAGTPGVVSSCGGAVTASAGSGSVSLSGGTMSGGMGSCTISVNVTSMVPGSNINGAGNISGLGNLLNGVTNQTLTVTVNADVSITKTNSTGIVTSGSTTTYSIVATNNGPGNANGAVISDPLPAGVSAFSWTCTASGGAICPNASGTGAINQTIATFPNGGSLIYTVTATISSTATGTVSNVATVTVPPGNTDPTPGDNTVTDGPDNVLLISDLSATNTNGVASVIPGTNSIYTVVFANGGPSQALGATLTDTLPLGITSANWTCAGAGGAVCPNANGSGAINETANIPSGGSLTYTMTVAVSPFAVGPFVSTATAALAAPATDPTPGNNSQTDSDVVFRDGDVDGVNDATDPDDDNDGILDVTEGRGVDPSGDADSDGLSNYGDPSFAGFVDGNNDGVNDNFDTDRDGIPDHLDLDADNDGIQDAIEGGGIDPDNDGRIGAGVIVDTDGDGLSNIVDADNGGTPLPIYNTDGAGDPDFQDLDADNDGIQDAIEGAGGITGDPDNDGRVGAGPVVDTDGDGWSNVVDSSNGGTAFPIPNSDGDAPALPDYRDLDADNDGIQDAVEGFGGPGGDPDNDGRVGAGPVVDTDGDGWSNVVDSTNGGTAFTVPNTDGDTTPLADYRDLDADNDGIQDAIEAGGSDSDNDGRIGTGPIVDTDGDGWSNVTDQSNG